MLRIEPLTLNEESRALYDQLVPQNHPSPQDHYIHMAADESLAPGLVLGLGMD